MTTFTTAGLIGLCIGFMWGIGCSLAILYSIYLGGYRKAVEDSLASEKPERFVRVLKKMSTRKNEVAEKSR